MGINFIGRDEETLTKMTFVYVVALKKQRGIEDMEGIEKEIEEDVNKFVDKLVEFKTTKYPNEEIDIDGISEFMSNLLFEEFGLDIIKETFEMLNM